MQGLGMSGERRPVCEGSTHWRSGDKVRVVAVTTHPAQGGVVVGLKGYSVAGSPGRGGQAGCSGQPGWLRTSGSS